MLVALVTPWPRPARIPMHGICFEATPVCTAQHHSAFQLQARPVLINRHADPWLPPIGFATIDKERTRLLMSDERARLRSMKLLRC